MAITNFLNKEKIYNNQNWFILIIGVFLFIYVLIRSLHLSFTYDEVVSFNEMKIVKWDNIGKESNRHYLNSLSMNFFSEKFGLSEFTLRLGSSLAFLIYFISAFKISTYFKSAFRIHVIIALVISPFLLDFFSLARGYGISLACLLLSLSFLYDTIKATSYLKLFLILFFAAISVISNLTFINYFLPLVATLLLLIFTNNLSLKNKILHISFVSLLISMFFALIIPILFELKKTDNLYFGGRENFLTDTIFSLGKSFAYHQKYGSIFQPLFSALFLLAIGISFHKISTVIKRRSFNSNSFLPILFLLSILSPIFQHLIFKTHFVVERTALFYFPILILIVLEAINKSVKLKIKLIPPLLSIILSLHFIFSLNTNHTYSWRFDSGTKEVLTDLQKITKDKPTILGVDHFRTPSMEFYKNNLKYDRLWVADVTLGNWSYPLNLEELNSYYYGQKEKKFTDKSVHIKNILNSKIYYYYLDNNLIEQLRKSKVNFKIIKGYDYSRATLIKIIQP